MGAFYETIPESKITWIRQQKVFWVATAPLSGKGHVNVSPKGGAYFGVLNDKQFWYLDLTGSGNETISHLLEPGNGRITIMFNAFDGPALILRLWGHGTVMEHGTKEFDKFVTDQSITLIPGARSIILVEIHQVGSSCGFSVPFYDFKEFRPVLNDFHAKKEKRFLEGKEEDRIDRYWAYKNAWSMDQLPGMRRGLSAAKQYKVKPMAKMVGPLAPTRYNDGLGFGVLHIILTALLGFGLGLVVTLWWASHSGNFENRMSPPLAFNIANLTGMPYLDALLGSS